MITQVRPDIRHVPLDKIDLNDTRYSFRLPLPDRESTLRFDLNRHGQVYPLALVERADGAYSIIDGYARVRALAGESSPTLRWERIMANVLHESMVDELLVFRRLCVSNLTGPFAYKTYDKCLFFSRFSAHLSVNTLAVESQLSIHEVEDCLELAKAPPSFGELINDTALPVLFCLMLFRRYQGWIKQGPAAAANAVTRRAIAAVDEKRIDIKHWRFYLDFFWGRGRPFMFQPS